MDTKLLKQKILDLAIHGKLVPQNPNDEPASKLLEKIREEKQKLIAEKKIKADKNDSYIFVGDDNRHYEKFADGTVKDIEDEIPFEVPEGWAWCRLGKIGTWQSGSTPDRKNINFYENGTIPWLLTGDLTDGIITDIPNKITELAFNKTSLKLNPKGSVCIAMYGGTIGKLGILDFPATTNQACCVCSDFKGIINKYLFYFLKQHKDIFIQQGFGGAQPNISKEKITLTLIPLPPISEQNRIIEEIEKTFQLINTLENNKEDLQTIIKLAKSKILDLAIHGKLVPQDPSEEPASKFLERLRAEKEAKIKVGELKRDKNDSLIYKNTTDNCYYQKFTDGSETDILGEIPFELPNNWCWCKANQLYNIRSAIRIHQTDWKSEGVPFFRGRELVELCKTGEVHPEIFISEELYEENKKKGGIPQKNDLLVSAVGTLGFVHIVEGTKKFYYKDAYILCFENHFNLNPSYTKLVIESDYTQKVIYEGSKGTTVDQLTIENAKSLWIPLPPLAEQKRIVEKIEKLYSFLDKIAKNLI